MAKLPGVTINYIDSVKNFVPNSKKGVVCMLTTATSSDYVVEIPGGDVPVEVSQDMVDMALAAGARKLIIIGCQNPSSYVGVAARYDFDVIFADYGTEATNVVSVVNAKIADGEEVQGVVDKSSSSTNLEYVTRLSTDEILLTGEENGSTIDSKTYVARIAGLIAGAGVKGSLTKLPLADVKSVPVLSKAEVQTEVEKGNLVLYMDKGIVKIAKGVNTKLPQNTANSKIRTITCKNAMSKLLKEVLDSHIGQTPNSYANKLLILGNITSALRSLAEEQVIENDFSVDLDIEAITDYLGESAKDLTYDELRRQDTADQLFVIVKVKLLDVIEEITIKVKA